jgi:hypothetical protein
MNEILEKEYQEIGIYIEEYKDEEKGEKGGFIVCHEFEDGDSAYFGKSLILEYDGPLINDPFESKEEALNAIETYLKKKSK